MTDKRVAILLDGGFVKKRLGCKGLVPAAADVEDYCAKLMQNKPLQGQELFRIYYYDAPPYDGVAANPISGQTVNFSCTKHSRNCKALIDSLEMKPLFAVRRGKLKFTDWKIGGAAFKQLKKGRKSTVDANDLIPNFVQKGVDMRIGLDIAWMAIKRIADILVLVAGDSDYVPAMKLARREGLHVYLDTIGSPLISPELKMHADLVL